jgi:hypothetical protein
LTSHDFASAYARPRSGERFTSISRARIKIIVFASLYFVAYAWVYVIYVSDLFGDLGFGYTAAWSEADVSVIACLAIAPSLWLPVTFDRPSAVFIYFQYFFIYVPAIWMTRHSILPVLSTVDQTILCVALPLSFGILLWSHHRLPLLKIPNVRIQGRLIWMFIYAISGLLLIALIGGLGGNFRLVGLNEIYSLRDSAADLIEASGSNLLKYAFPWVNGLLLPMIYARAVQKSNYLMILAVVICYGFLFGIWGSKTSLFGPLMLIAASMWASSGTSRMPLLMIAGLIVAQIVPALLPFESGVGNLIKLAWLSIVNMRTFSIPGLAIVQYYDFFLIHPWTLGSQITGLNWIVHYPYDYNIPQTLGYYYYGTLVTANANFWAQDGLAGFGVIGLGFTSIIAALVFWILDSVTRGMSMKFLIPALVGIIVSFANVSLFTTLITGGLGFFILACVFMPRADSQGFASEVGATR